MCFGYDIYYPQGGISDCKFKTDDYQEAKNWLVSKVKQYDRAYIYDVQTDDILDLEDICK